MSKPELDKKLKAILKEEVEDPIVYGEGVNPKDYFGIDTADIIAQIKAAFLESDHTTLSWVQSQGYAKVKKLPYRDEAARQFMQYTIDYPDGKTGFCGWNLAKLNEMIKEGV